MTVESALLALAGVLGVTGGSIAILRMVLPWLRKIVPAAVSISGKLEASQDRLVASQHAEIELSNRQRDDARKREAECRAELDECVRRAIGDRP